MRSAFVDRSRREPTKALPAWPALASAASTPSLTERGIERQDRGAIKQRSVLHQTAAAAPTRADAQMEEYVRELETQVARKTAALEEVTQLHTSLAERFAKLDDGFALREAQLEALRRQYDEACRCSTRWRVRAEELEGELTVMRSALFESSNNVTRLQELLGSVSSLRSPAAPELLRESRDISIQLSTSSLDSDSAAVQLHEKLRSSQDEVADARKCGAEQDVAESRAFELEEIEQHVQLHADVVLV